MTPQEWDQYVVCSDCSEVIDSSLAPVFVVDEVDCLCLECSVERGGVYDAPGERWVHPPGLVGLR